MDKMARLKSELLSDGSEVYAVAFYDEEQNEQFRIEMDSIESSRELLKIVRKNSSDTSIEDEDLIEP